MEQFDYNKIIPTLMVPEVVSALGTIREHRGKQALYAAIRPDILNSLVETAKIQSTGSSNRIENISTSDKRLRELIIDKVEPRNRDEREIAGYRYVLDLIHENYEAIPVKPGTILQLHRDLYRFSDTAYAGKWKDTDNVIAERRATGEMVARFRPTSAIGTPSAMERLCTEYHEQIDNAIHDPLLVSLLFAFDFVSIHPFNDGNGRMSRLLTLLLLYQNGYTVGKYISLEKEIERTKTTYYETLAASSVGWQEGTNNYLPFVTYLLGIITACYKELDERFAFLTSASNNEDTLRSYFEGALGAVTKREIMEANPSMSQRTIERILQKLQAEEVIEKVGAARATAYRRKDK